MRPGQGLIGMLAPLTDPGLAAALATQGVSAVSLDRLPRTLTRTQPMDALSSQANVAGYKAAVIAAAEFGRFFPLLITAAGTARPAKVLVLGAGVAGLQAIGTARRLGAVVSGYDVRPASKNEVESLGATFIELTSVRLRGGRGRLRARADRRGAAGPAGRAARPHRPHDVVITTAQVPGRRPPLLVTEDALKAMAPGSVIVDMGASAAGRQRRRAPGRARRRHRQRGHDHRGRQPARHHADRGVQRVLAQRLRAAAVPDLRRRAGLSTRATRCTPAW